MSEEEKTFIRRLIVRVAICVGAIACLLGGCSYLNQKLGLPDDHPIEEMFDDFVEDQTGIDWDSTPENGLFERLNLRRVFPFDD